RRLMERCALSELRQVLSVMVGPVGGGALLAMPGQPKPQSGITCQTLHPLGKVERGAVKKDRADAVLKAIFEGRDAVDDKRDARCVQFVSRVTEGFHPVAETRECDAL